MSECWQMMVVKVKLSRSMEKIGLSSPQQLLLASFGPYFVDLWYTIVCPGCVLPSWDWLLWLFICNTVTGTGEWRPELISGAQGRRETRKTFLHCTARMATDPEIAGVWYKDTPQKALYKMTVLLLRKFKSTEWKSQRASSWKHSLQC